MPTRLLWLLPLLAACGLTPESKDDGDDSGDDSGNGGGEEATIFDINEGRVGDGDSVTLKGVLVSSPLTRADENDDGTPGRSDGFFVQDPAGGAGSGLYVWKQGGIAANELDLERGDEITVSGQVQDYYGWLEFVVTDLASIEKTGSGTLPEPVDLGDGSGVDWTDYESTPVTLTNQVVDSVDEFSTGYLSGGVWLDDGFQYNDFDCRGSFTSVTGIVFYTYERHSINNRDAADLAGYAPGDTLPATIAEIRSGAVCGPVSVSGVVATTPSSGDTSSLFFVQSPGGGENSGLAVYLAGTVWSPEVGDTLDIAGSLTEYRGLTELTVGSADDVVTTGAAEVVTDALAAAPADWEVWESARIAIADVTATADEDEQYGNVPTDKGFDIDDLFVDFSARSGDHWSSVSGVLQAVDYGEPAWYLQPVTDADLVP